MEEGHEVTIVAQRDSPARDASPRVLPIGGDWSWAAMNAIADQIARERPDSVALCYVNHLGNRGPAPTMLPAMLRRRGYRGPFVTIFSNPVGFDKRRHLGAAARFAVASRLLPNQQYNVGYGTLLSSDRIVCLSLWHAAYIRARLTRAPERVVVFPPFSTLTLAPTTLESREEGRRRLGANPNDIVVTNFGYIRPEKRVEMLIAAAEVLRDVPHLRFVVAGAEDFSESGYVASLKSRVAESRLGDRFLFTGGYPAGGVEGSLWLHGSDVCVLPTAGGVTLNNSSLASALRHGLPTIATRSAPRGVEDPDLDAPIVERIAFVVEDDVASLAHGIRSLAVDPYRRLAMRKAALVAAERLYSPSAMVGAITEFSRPVEGLTPNLVQELLGE